MTTVGGRTRTSRADALTAGQVSASYTSAKPGEPRDRGRSSRTRSLSASRKGKPGTPVGSWPLRPGDPGSVNGYRPLARLGSGGSADVFYAASTTGIPVVLKLFRSARRTVDVCRREFRLSYAVDADCTAAPLGYGVAAAGAYLVSTYLPGYRPGSTLTATLDPRRFGTSLARTLAAVHSRNIVHCDVKPSNLLIGGDDVRVIDFGISRYTGQRCGAEGLVECSRGWAAPEQVRDERVTPAVDVFAWGCVMAYLTSGIHPFASASEQEWILRLQSAEPDVGDLPADLEDTVRAALARDPRARPTAAEIAARCGSCTADRGGASRVGFGAFRHTRDQGIQLHGWGRATSSLACPR